MCEFGDETKLHPTVVERINEVSKEWNALVVSAIHTAKTTEVKTEFGNFIIRQESPIVAMLQPDGKMIPLSMALSKLFELLW